MADDIDFHTAIVTFQILSYDASELQCSCNNSECLLDIRQTLIVTMQHRYSLYVVPPYLPDALRTVLVVPAQGPSGATILSNDAGVELLPMNNRNCGAVGVPILDPVAFAAKRHKSPLQYLGSFALLCIYCITSTGSNRIAFIVFLHTHEMSMSHL